MIEEAGADYIHVDVMDGHFVPNITYGSTVMKSLLGKTSLPFDVHLMIEEADRHLDDFVTESTEFIVVHAEANRHLNRTIQRIKKHGVKAGVALNPATSLATLDFVLEDVDLILIMSVNPGFGGQRFIESPIDKVGALNAVRQEYGLVFDIEVDGGVSLDNAANLKDAGADILVAGSALFKTKDPAARIREFKERF